MAFRYRLTHHPNAALDFQESKDFFAEIDADLAELFKTDFRAALRERQLGARGRSEDRQTNRES